MTHRSDTPRVFWSREDWLAEIDSLEAKIAAAEAGNGTDSVHIWRERLKQARTELRACEG